MTGSLHDAARIVSGSDARTLIERELAAHEGGIFSTLSSYRPEDAVAVWHDAIRAAEEFINVPIFGIREISVERALLSIPLRHASPDAARATFAEARSIVSARFEPGVLGRYMRTLLQISAIAEVFAVHGHRLGRDQSLDTVGDAVAYFQSRRRHMVSLLYTMPLACRGSQRLTGIDAMNVLLPQIEYSCISITGFHIKLAQLENLDDFALELDEHGVRSSSDFDMLEDYFLEPERASIHVMSQLRAKDIVLPDMEAVPPRKIFSAAELRNSVKLIGATYAAFGLTDSDFSTISSLIILFSRHAHDDYAILIDKVKFHSIVRSQGIIPPAELERMLVNSPSDYATNSNAHEPFIDMGGALLSNVNLLSRFLYAFKNVHLGSRRRFQIHAGFIFEDMVKHRLTDLGYEVTAIKRINRKEFDVVAVRAGTIYNLQCKNNFVDLSRIESNRKIFTRYNRSLVSYYRRALSKEYEREALLKHELGLERIVHFIVSRFPVMTDDPRIINYNSLDRLRRI